MVPELPQSQVQKGGEVKHEPETTVSVLPCTLREWLQVPGHELKPGDIVTLRTGERLLVGNINDLGGVCDDCVEPRIVVRIDRRETNG